MREQSFLSVLFCTVMLSACTAAPAAQPVPSSDPNIVATPSEIINNEDTVSSPPNMTEAPFPTNKKITVKGKSVCLPKKNPGEVQTLECASGIKTADGKHYGLQLDEKFSMSFQTDREYTVDGYFKDEPTSNYDIVGVILVTNLK